MQNRRCALCALVLIVSFAVLVPAAFAQQVIATVPTGISPFSSAFNSANNKVYVPNQCGWNPNCGDPPYSYSLGTVTIVDGNSNNPTTVNVGYFPSTVAVNPQTNKIYVANECGSDSTCWSAGTVSVIDGGSNTVVATITVGSDPRSLTVNSATNRIYVANYCGNDNDCYSHNGTVTVINGATNTVITTVNVGVRPAPPVVNSMTNKIYVPNYCGNDSSCSQSPYNPGTVTVIDGATNNPTSVTVGRRPHGIDVNSGLNQTYVANECGDDPSCAGTGTMTVIDGVSLATTDVPIGGYYPWAIAVNSSTNKIYVPAYCWGDASCQGGPTGTVSVIDGQTLSYTSVAVGEVAMDSMVVNSATNQIYIANECGNDSNCYSKGTVTVIDGATHVVTNVFVGSDPYNLSLNPLTNRVYVPNICGDDTSCNTYNGTLSVIDGTPPTALQFVPLSQPCRAVDTRPDQGGGGPIQAGTQQDFLISDGGQCGVFPWAAAYSLNVTVVPQRSLGYLTIWPTGKPRPVVSTMNSLDGRIKADAAIVPAGTSGKISVYATDTTHVVVDVNGYFAPVTQSTLAFYPLPPCRVADTRDGSFPQGLGPPALSGGGQPRSFPILDATSCNIPTGAQAYSLNFTVVPSGWLSWLAVWPTGQDQPTVSTLNDTLGRIIANAAIVVAGGNGEVSVYATNNTDLVIDINGYFAPAGAGGLSLYPVQPCRALDTRYVGSGLPFQFTLTPAADVVDAGCATSSLAQGYAFNATVLPRYGLGYLTLWPDGPGMPVVSTLNALDGSITNNMAIVPTNNGWVDAYASDLTQLLLDVSSYFAP